MKIEVHIDRLVIDAASPALDQARLARAVSQALAQRIDSPPPLPASAPPGQRLGHHIAAAVHRAIPGASRGGRP